MSAPKKHCSRSNKNQITYLCRYMAENPEFAAGDYRSPQGARSQEEQWERLKEALDELGPQRSVAQWKTCWRDQKLKARKAGAAHNKAINATGNIDNIPEIDENAVLILNTIGPEMATGIGPNEAPIGYDPIVSIEESIDTNVVEIPQGSQPQRQPRPRQRRRHALPPDRFLSAQLELNGLMRELITEVRRSNELRQELIDSRRSTSTMEAET